MVTNAAGCLGLNHRYIRTLRGTSLGSTLLSRTRQRRFRGVEAAYQLVKRRGRWIRTSSSSSIEEQWLYDMGLQSLSGAMERNHNFVYVCSRQRGVHEHRSPTVIGHPQGEPTHQPTRWARGSYGKRESRKDLTNINAALTTYPYAAQASLHLNDIYQRGRESCRKSGGVHKRAGAVSERVEGTMPRIPSRSAAWPLTRASWPLYEVVEGQDPCDLQAQGEEARNRIPEDPGGGSGISSSPATKPCLRRSRRKSTVGGKSFWR